MEVILAVEDIKDNQNEIITKECLVRCVKEFKELNIMGNFDSKMLIGRVTKVRIEDNKLIGTIEFKKDINIDFKDKKFRLGFMAIKAEFIEGVLTYKEIELLSVSMFDYKDEAAHKEEYLEE